MFLCGCFQKEANFFARLCLTMFVMFSLMCFLNFHTSFLYTHTPVQTVSEFKDTIINIQISKAPSSSEPLIIHLSIVITSTNDL